MSIKIQTIFLVGSKDVQDNLKNYLEIFDDKQKTTKNQSELYGKLIQSMKIDLYNRKWKVTTKKFNSIDEITLTVFTSDK